MRHTELGRRGLQRREHDADLVDLRGTTGLGPVIQPAIPSAA